MNESCEVIFISTREYPEMIITNNNPCGNIKYLFTRKIKRKLDLTFLILRPDPCPAVGQ